MASFADRIIAEILGLREKRPKAWWLYCAEDRHLGQVKLGITSDQRRRTLALRGHRYRLNPVCWWELGTCRRADAEAVERAVHAAVGAHFEALGHERFAAATDDVLALVDNTLLKMLPHIYGDDE